MSHYSHISAYDAAIAALPESLREAVQCMPWEECLQFLCQQVVVDSSIQSGDAALTEQLTMWGDALVQGGPQIEVDPFHQVLYQESEVSICQEVHQPELGNAMVGGASVEPVPTGQVPRTDELDNQPLDLGSQFLINPPKEELFLLTY